MQPGPVRRSPRLLGLDQDLKKNSSAQTTQDSAEMSEAQDTVRQNRNEAIRPLRQSKASTMVAAELVESDSSSTQELEMGPIEEDGVAQKFADNIDQHLAQADELVLGETDASSNQATPSPFSDGNSPSRNAMYDTGLDADDGIRSYDATTPLHLYAKDNDGYSVGEAIDEWVTATSSRPGLALEQFLLEIARAFGDEIPAGLVQHIQTLQDARKTMEELMQWKPCDKNNVASTNKATPSEMVTAAESEEEEEDDHEEGRTTSSISHYLDEFPDADVGVPSHFTLKDICEKLPNHVYGTRLDAFIQYFWTAGQIYSFFTDETKELLKKKAKNGSSKQVINFIQKRLSSRWKELKEEGVGKLMDGEKIRTSHLDATGDETYGISDPLGLGLNHRAPARNYRRGLKTKTGT